MLAGDLPRGRRQRESLNQRLTKMRVKQGDTPLRIHMVASSAASRSFRVVSGVESTPVSFFRQGPMNVTTYNNSARVLLLHH